MKNRIRLTEGDLIRLVKRVINENHEENSLYKEIKSVIRNSISPSEERVNILRMIADEIESGASQRKETLDRWDKDKERSRKRGGLDPNNQF